MNPFAWGGLAFLGFYALLAAGVILLFFLWILFLDRSRREVSMTEMTSDPYRIAYLRGGPAETIRVAVFNLVDRGILAIDDEKRVSQAWRDAPDLLRRPVDRELLRACARPIPLEKLLAHRAALALCGQYRSELEHRGLFAGSANRRWRGAAALAALALLAGVALAKIVIALSRGAPMLFLLVLAISACMAILWFWRRHSTPAGRRMLRNLKTLTRRLKGRLPRLATRGATNEALILAAVFGLHALRSEAFPYAEWIDPRVERAFEFRLELEGEACAAGCNWSSASCGGVGGCGGGCGGCGGCGGD